jgi:16S rRNA G966 N2-methylase RsmD
MKFTSEHFRKGINHGLTIKSGHDSMFQQDTSVMYISLSNVLTLAQAAFDKWLSEQKELTGLQDYGKWIFSEHESASDTHTCYVCCGKSTIGNVRVDLFDETADIKADAAKLPFPDDSFDTVLCDPPYNGKLQWNHDLLSELSRVAKKRIVFQHWFMPGNMNGLYKKDHSFKISQLYIWQPRTYFGRVNVLSVFDKINE